MPIPLIAWAIGAAAAAAATMIAASGSSSSSSSSTSEEAEEMRSAAVEKARREEAKRDLEAFLVKYSLKVGMVNTTCNKIIDSMLSNGHGVKICERMFEFTPAAVEIENNIKVMKADLKMRDDLVRQLDEVRKSLSMQA